MDHFICKKIHFLAVSILLMTIALPAIAKNIERTSIGTFQSYISIDDRPVHLIIGDVKIVVPRNYLYTVMYKANSTRDDKDIFATLSVTYPDLSGVTKNNRECFEPGARCKVDIFINLLNDNIPAMAQRVEESSERVDMGNGLGFYPSSPAHGISDSYIATMPGVEGPAVIECEKSPDTAENSDFHPCRWMFDLWGKVPVEVKFDKRHLPEWTSFYPRLRALLTSFEEKP